MDVQFVSCRALVVLIFTFTTTLLSSLAFGQTEAQINEVNTPQLAALKKKSFQVVKEHQGQVVINRGGLAIGQRIMFVRPIIELDEFEMVSQGTVKVSNEKLSLVEIKEANLSKFPQSGDLAVSMGEPMKFDMPEAVPGDEGFEVPEKDPPEPEAGYFQLGFSSNQGGMNSTTTNKANSYKIVDKYNYQGFSFVWHPEFLSSYGLEYEQIQGNVPLYDYFRILQPTTKNISRFKISYRNQLIGDAKFRYKIFLFSETSEFSTSNTDEYVLTSSQTGLGLGALIGYTFNNVLPNSSTGVLGSPVGVYVDFFMVPSLNVKDSGSASRGNASGGSTMQGYSFLYSHVFYAEFIPWFKRYFLDIKYATTDSKISFQGPTKNLNSNFYVIPENGSYTEKETIISVTFGLRFEDWAGRALKPRSK